MVEECLHERDKELELLRDAHAKLEDQWIHQQHYLREREHQVCVCVCARARVRDS